MEVDERKGLRNIMVAKSQKIVLTLMDEEVVADK